MGCVSQGLQIMTQFKTKSIQLQYLRGNLSLIIICSLHTAICCSNRTFELDLNILTTTNVDHEQQWECQGSNTAHCMKSWIAHAFLIGSCSWSIEITSPSTTFFFLPYKIDSMLPWVSTITDQRRLTNEVKENQRCTQLICHLFLNRHTATYNLFV